MLTVAAALMVGWFQDGPGEGLRKSGETMEDAAEHLHRAGGTSKPGDPAKSRPEVEAALERQKEALRFLDEVLEHLKKG